MGVMGDGQETHKVGSNRPASSATTMGRDVLEECEVAFCKGGFKWRHEAIKLWLMGEHVYLSKMSH